MSNDIQHLLALNISMTEKETDKYIDECIHRCIQEAAVQITLSETTKRMHT